MSVELRPGVSVFSVFDGHGGNEISKFCADHFAQFLQAAEGFLAQEYELALAQTFLRLDEAIANGEYDRELEMNYVKPLAGNDIPES